MACHCIAKARVAAAEWDDARILPHGTQGYRTGLLRETNVSALPSSLRRSPSLPSPCLTGRRPMESPPSSLKRAAKGNAQPHGGVPIPPFPGAAFLSCFSGAARLALWWPRLATFSLLWFLDRGWGAGEKHTRGQRRLLGIGLGGGRIGARLWSNGLLVYRCCFLQINRALIAGLSRCCSKAHHSQLRRSNTTWAHTSTYQPTNPLITPRLSRPVRLYQNHQHALLDQLSCRGPFGRPALVSVTRLLSP